MLAVVPVMRTGSPPFLFTFNPLFSSLCLALLSHRANSIAATCSRGYVVDHPELRTCMAYSAPHTNCRILRAEISQKTFFFEANRLDVWLEGSFNNIIVKKLFTKLF